MDARGGVELSDGGAVAGDGVLRDGVYEVFSCGAAVVCIKTNYWGSRR